MRRYLLLMMFAAFAWGNAQEPPPGGEGGVIGVVPDGWPVDRSLISDIIVSIRPQLPRVAAPTRVRVSAGVAQGLLLTQVPPHYPPSARAERIQGTVTLRVVIDKEGKVSEIGAISGPPPLAPAAIAAVRQWKYKPYMLNQKPVEVETVVLVRFSLAW